jgi:phosphatidylserine synthase
MALVSLKPKTADSKELSPLVKTSLVWASFMVASSNLRYQTVNCIEERVLDTVFTGAPRNLATLVLRFANCFSGSLQVRFGRHRVSLPAT